MPKIEMTQEQSKLYSEMKKLSKKANQRIIRLERLTGETESFATKQLADYLSSDTLNAWTEKRQSWSKKRTFRITNEKYNKSNKKILTGRNIKSCRSKKLY